MSEQTVVEDIKSPTLKRLALDITYQIKAIQEKIIQNTNNTLEDIRYDQGTYLGLYSSLNYLLILDETLSTEKDI